MRIGFDAKRVFMNHSGLGVYGRTLVRSLADRFKENEYHLYTPRETSLFDMPGGVAAHTPQSFAGKTIPSLWRTKGIIKDLQAHKLDIYHGLSNELPYGIEKTGIKTVVTLHDLIFLHHPEYYRTINQKIYTKKFRNACKIADEVVTISQQTANDAVHFFDIDPAKISVIYQSCRPEFFEEIDPESTRTSLERLQLKPGYILTVGAGNPRKNIGVLMQALATFVPESRPQLVVAGGKNKYALALARQAHASRLTPWVKFIWNPDNHLIRNLYDGCGVFAFPSHIEGFGIPLLEAMASKKPIVATNNAGFREICEDVAIYATAEDPREWGPAIQELLTKTAVKEALVEKGVKRANWFREYDGPGKWNALYERLISKRGKA